MNIFDLKKAIRAQTVGQFYVFHGFEREGMRIYWEHLAECSGRTVQIIDQVRDAFTYKKSLLDKPKLFVCYADKEFMTNESARDKVATLGDNALVLTVDSIDKRSKFYKAHEDICIAFDAFSVPVLTHHIQKVFPISDDMCKRLIEACNGSYGRILLELDKVQAIAQALPDWKPDEVVDEMLYRGVIHEDTGDLLFDLGNAIIAKDKATAYACAQAGDIPPLKLITVLYNALRRLLLVQTCRARNYRDAEITKETGLTSKEIYGISKNLNKRSSENIASCLQILRKCETGIKGGTLCEEHAIDYILISLI